MTPLFEIGQLVATPTALAALQDLGITAEELLARHQTGDWGDITSEQRTLNESGLHERCSIQSEYACGQQRITLVTRPDRTTTLLHLSGRK